MSAEQGPAAPDPDDLDRQLRELTSGVAEAPRFTEPSAAERARLAAGRGSAKPASRPSKSAWRNTRKTRKLRRPIDSPGRPGRARSGGGGPAARRKPAKARTPKQQRLRSAAKAAAILIGFVALLLLLHALGFGPQ